MNVYYSIEEAQRSIESSVISVGMFDGVHLGHVELITEVKDIAVKEKCLPCLVTFDPHPRKYFQSSQGALLLTSLEHKLEILKNLGIENCLVIRFDEFFSKVTPEKFIKRLWEAVCFKAIVIGKGFCFGKNRRGDITLLGSLAQEYGFMVKEINPLKIDNTQVSSTEVRKSVLSGDLALTKRMLGRDFSVLGTVVSGHNIGRGLGYPTANLDPHQEIVPPGGVYIVRGTVKDVSYYGLANIGCCPTFIERRKDYSIEIYLFDFDEYIYSEKLEVFFLKRIRDEKKFDSVDALLAQIKKDEKQAGDFLSKENNCS